MRDLVLRLVLALIRQFLQELDPVSKSNIIQSMYRDWDLTTIHRSLLALERERERWPRKE